MSLRVSEQTALLRKCLAEDLDLDEALANRGLCYDDLRYRRAESKDGLFPLEPLSVAPMSIDQFESNGSAIPCVSFFAGAGGMDLGFSRLGFRNIAAIEMNETFCRTLRENRASDLVIGPPEWSGDARRRDEIQALLAGKVGLKKGGFSGVFHGGPPCQSFSIAANQRFNKNGRNFKRIGFSNKDYGTLLFDYVFYIKEFMPEVFVIENVSGLLTADDGGQMSEAFRELRNSGYSLSGPALLNSADYGVPQNRVRAFIVGHQKRRQGLLFPAPVPKRVPCGAVFCKPLDNAPNHITRKHRAESVLRYMELDFGARDKLGRVDRLDPTLPSKTVIAGGSNGGGRSHLHPFVPRTLSVRESARLQTFPDSYVFFGSPARQFTQVGNAVPPVLACHIARAIKEHLFEGKP